MLPVAGVAMPGVNPLRRSEPPIDVPDGDLWTLVLPAAAAAVIALSFVRATDAADQRAGC